MKKVMTFFITALFISLAATCSARIVVECDDYSHTVSYRSYKTIGGFGIARYSFIKNITANETFSYFIAKNEKASNFYSERIVLIKKKEDRKSVV